ncbi:MAG: GntR family transcriptional regulator [Xanthobacteraceae bacterium]|nr:GntR family transcriptional regulator [Xanthobacteraceae bacterium]
MAARTKTEKANGNRDLLYRDVADKLRSRISTGKYPPKAKLPSLYDLVEEFGVSAISVRRALKDLTYEGLVYGEQGRGVFVKEKGIIHRVLAATTDQSIGDEIARAGFTPNIKEIGHTRIKATEEVAARLKLKSGTRIWQHQKIAYADQEPVSLHYLFYPEPLAAKLKDTIGKSFVFRMLENAKIKVVQSRFEFGAGGLSAEHADHFKQLPGTPMGHIYFTPQTKDGNPILTGLTIYRSDRFLFAFDVPH